MEGPIALVGSGEFTPAMEAVDRDLLASAGRARPRVVVLATASAPDGEEVFEGWNQMGREHFGALGADVEALPVRERSDAENEVHAGAVLGADLVYLSGGKPDYLYETLAGTAVERALRAAWQHGSAVAGCSAGAMVLAEFRMTFALGGVPSGWRPGLGLVGGVGVAPHYDRFPEAMVAPLILRAPPGCHVLGIDENTALVGGAHSWQVRGPGRVTVWSGHRRVRYRDRDVVRI